MVLFDRFQRPLRDLRISVIDACNFRCNYCMPLEQFPTDHPFLKPTERLSWDQLFNLVKIFSETGVKKIRLTGGEPLLRIGIADFIAKIKNELSIDEITLTTNGFYLVENALNLKKAGLDRITISLDTLDPDKAYYINGKKDILPKILDGIAAVNDSGYQQTKINMVVQKGINDNEIISMAEYFRHSPFILRFIEFMDVGTRNQWQLSKVVPSREIVEMIDMTYPIQPVSANYVGEVANRYQYADGAGEIGFISSVTQPFCRDCSRARITSDGVFYTCLFATEGTSLKEYLATNSESQKIKHLITKVWNNRNDRYSEERTSNTITSKKVEMNHMGG